MKLLTPIVLLMAAFATSTPVPDGVGQLDGPNDVAATTPIENDSTGLIEPRQAGQCHKNQDCGTGWCYNGICMADGHCRSSVDCPGKFYCWRGNCINR
ncbi:hypothetical protein BDV59DRAFT_187406 [Aspergillus ambiguus]|uniref:uncharacterized protein n=1 Tax=Aspergillus ambiguus TaxID=176160 RepID=UPI003CCCC53D